MRILKGWKIIDNKRGYMNVTTGENVVVIKKKFGVHYLAVLFPFLRDAYDEGTKITPEYATESKAWACAIDWMNKHANGTEQSVES